METASETSSRCGTLPGSKNDARDRVNANSHPRCILPLHSNCWAEISTLAASELAPKKRVPDRGTTPRHGSCPGGSSKLPVALHSLQERRMCCRGGRGKIVQSIF